LRGHRTAGAATATAAAGTAAGTAADKTVRLPDGTRPKDLFLKVGDVVEVSSPQIGTLRNRIVSRSGGS